MGGRDREDAGRSGSGLARAMIAPRSYLGSGDRALWIKARESLGFGFDGEYGRGEDKLRSFGEELDSGWDERFKLTDKFSEEEKGISVGETVGFWICWIWEFGMFGIFSEEG